MVFRRRTRSLRPVHRIKHVIDNQQGLTGGTQGFVDLAISVDAPVLASTTQVETGSSINGIFLVVEITNTEATQGVLANAYMMVTKNPGGNLTFPNANVIGSSDNKKYVIHQEMVMLQKQSGSNPRTLFRGVIVIPQLYRRFAINDVLTVHIFAPGVDMDACVQCHYREFR